MLSATLAPSTGSTGKFVLRDDAVVADLVSHWIIASAWYFRTSAYMTLAMLS